MKKVPFLKLIVAKVFNYAFWLLLLTLIVDHTSLSLPTAWLLAVAPIMMVVFGTLSLKLFKTTLGFKLMRIQLQPPISWKDAFIASLPWTSAKKLSVKAEIPIWRYVFALATGVCALVLQFNDPVYGFTSSGSIQNSSWVQYTHEEKGFTVYFPDEPKEASKPLTPSGDTGLNYTEMSSKEKKGTYSLSYLKMPRKWGIAGENTILKVALDLIVKNTPNAKIIARETINHQGHKAINYTLQVDGKEIVGRLLIHDRILYKLNVEYPEGSSSKVASDEFLSSFSIQ